MGVIIGFCGRYRLQTVLSLQGLLLPESERRIEFGGILLQRRAVRLGAVD